MQQHREFGRLYSASDLVAHQGCQHRTTLDLRRLEGWGVEPVAADAANRLVQEYGDRHEREHLRELKGNGLEVLEINKRAPLAEKVRETHEAMRHGAAIIFQATLLQPPFLGYADFLIRVPGQSSFGDFHYELADTKLAKSNRAKFLIQLGFYADLLVADQRILPEYLHVVLGRLTEPELERHGLRPGQSNVARLRTQDCIHYVRNLRTAFVEFVAKRPPTQPLPTAACDSCGWREHCNSEWERADHVCRVANIRRGQIGKLAAAGITTMTALAKLAPDQQVDINAPVLAKLRGQAALQCRPTEDDGRMRLEFLPPRDEDQPSGFDTLPAPDPGDLYFDMEGFPHEPGGLEYLFGVGWFEPTDAGRAHFQPFWAHDRIQEKHAFETFMDFVDKHLQKHPNAHIYHYAPYERSAIKRLSSVHDTRTELRDRLLREHRLVDLYRVVRTGLQLALPSYSLKEVERYYRCARDGDVANAADSIVQYEAFRSTDDAKERTKLLDAIGRYNRDDVESTAQLHRWLEGIRPRKAVPEGQSASVGTLAATEDASERAAEREARERAAMAALAEWARRQPPQDFATNGPFAELLGYLLGFYWRCKLPTFWRIYERMEAEPEDLLDDHDCLAMLTFTGRRWHEANSIRYEYQVPPQETKLGTGSDVRCLTDDLPASSFVYDEDAGLASFKRSANTIAPPAIVSLGPRDNFNTAPKLDSIYRYVVRLCAVEANKNGRDALRSLLTRERPNVNGIRPGEPLVHKADLDEILGVIRRLDHTHLVIQGPPGTGKTTYASQVIAQLVRDGCRVAITSNSHAAINHLLTSSWQRCADLGINPGAAVVKPDEALPRGIQVVDSNRVDSDIHRLVGGTGWLFCREAQRDRWDYLFVDEASQVSLADVVAAGPCARNIVLLGDQMQLPQPTQGVHPGESGLSALEFAIRNQATVPPEQGIFLGESFRMHPDLCNPISEGVYEGRLQHHPTCTQQRLVLAPDADPALRTTGIVWVPARHHDRSQSAPEEVERIAKIYRSLLRQHWIDRKGQQHPIGSADVLVLAPYNAQVRALKRKLGADARVGTVDKFQGQEAPVLLFSMTSSDAESMPRGLDFLFSINRLNVAVSRARCLAVIVASPPLRIAPCTTVEDVKRVNFFARLTEICAKPQGTVP